MSYRFSIKNGGGYIDIKPRRHRRTRQEIEEKEELERTNMKEMVESVCGVPFAKSLNDKELREEFNKIQ